MKTLNYRARNLCLLTILLVLVLSNIINYFYCYKYLEDGELEWKIAIYSIAIELFLGAVYVWLVQITKPNNSIKIILSGWAGIYLLINLIGVLAGYRLHSKGFMAMLFVTTFFGLAHLIAKLWQKYF